QVGGDGAVRGNRSRGQLQLIAPQIFACGDVRGGKIGHVNLSCCGVEFAEIAARLLKREICAASPAGGKSEVAKVFDGTSALDVMSGNTSRTELNRSVDDEAHLHPVDVRNHRQPQQRERMQP